MKNMRKIASLVLALVMVFAMATTAFADETTDGYTLTVTGESGHTYEVYQIFTGDLSGDVLSNVKWGNGVTTAGQEALGDAAVKAESLTSDNIDTFKAAVNDYLQNPQNMTYSEGKYTLSGLAAGYYLVKDKDGTQEGENGTYTAYILQIVKNVSVGAKVSVPSVDKSVNEQNVNAADASIGDTVTFILKATLGSELDEYDTYKLVFHDTMGNGLTFKEYTTATLGDKDVKANFVMTQDGQNLTFTCTDVKALGATDGSVITITYTATLNSNAEIGKPGNKNEVYLEYSNNPDYDGTGDNTTGNTPKDEVLVFTYELDVDKVAGEDTTVKLKDAEFVLMNSDGSKYAIVDDNGKLTGWTEDETKASTLKSDDNGEFKVVGLDAGTYKLKETKAPQGYNLLSAPVEIVIAASLNTAENSAALETLTISVNNGTAASGNLETGVVDAQITNNQGSTLPTTGGMGTTLFYLVGGILVVAAVVLLVTKKRMAAAE